MEQIILVREDILYDVNKELEKGWRVKQIIPFNQTVSRTGQFNGVEYGLYGAYVVLEKQAD